MPKQSVKLFAPCGWSAEVTEAENGQSLGGTAGDVAARHEGRCARCGNRNTEGVTADWGSNQEPIAP